MRPCGRLTTSELGCWNAILRFAAQRELAFGKVSWASLLHVGSFEGCQRLLQAFLTALSLSMPAHFLDSEKMIEWFEIGKQEAPSCAHVFSRVNRIDLLWFRFVHEGQQCWTVQKLDIFKSWTDAVVSDLLPFLSTTPHWRGDFKPNSYSDVGIKWDSCCWSMMRIMRRERMCKWTSLSAEISNLIDSQCSQWARAKALSETTLP